jgi:ankyrin repeat protein
LASAAQASTARVLLEGVAPTFKPRAKVNRVDLRGRSALSLAAALCEHPAAGARAKLAHNPMLRLLLEHNAKSIPDFEHKRTPLMLAAKSGGVEAMSLLLNAVRR